MPDGKTHKLVWKKLFLLPVAVAFIFFVTGSYYFSLWIIVGYLLHGVGGITNDLDLISIDSGEAKWIKSIILIPLVAWSTAYARIMQVLGGHRNFWSHGFVISTFIRLMWFGFPFIAAFRYFFTDPLYLEFFGMFIGLAIADSIHSILDMTSGEITAFISKKRIK
jgi:uncharacterized metal-binding protein